MSVIARVEKTFSKDGILEREHFYGEEGTLILQRLYNATPSGGDFSELYYLNGCPYDLHEYRADGTLIMSTILHREYQSSCCTQ